MSTDEPFNTDELSEEPTFGEKKESQEQEEASTESPSEQAEERPIGSEEQKTIEEQEKEVVEQPESKMSEKTVNKVEKPKPIRKKNEDTKKLFDQFTRHFQASKIASDKTTIILKQIQKQLVQVEKIGAIVNKQEAVLKPLASQVRTIQKQLDKVASSIKSIKNIQSVKKKSTNNKRKKK